MPIKTIIFDMDGVLFDTEPLSVRAWDYAGEKMGFGPCGYMSLRTLGMNKPAIMKVWAEEFGDRFSPDELDRHAHAFFDRYYAEHKTPEKPGLHQALDFFKSNGYKIGLASSSRRETVLKHLADSEITGYFDVIVSGDMIAASKPAPDIYLKACKLLGEPPENCYAVEDSKNGIVSAWQAGCRVVFIPDLWPGDEETERLPAVKVDDLLGLVKWLKSEK